MMSDRQVSKNIYGVLSKNIPQNGLSRLLPNSIVAGGAVSSLLAKEEPNDYDVFFTDPEQLEGFVNYVFRSLSSFVKATAPSDFVVEQRGDLFFGGFAGANTTQEARYFSTIERYYQSLGRGRPPTIPIWGPISFVTPNSITIGKKIQVITRYAGPPEAIIDGFDYEHCKVYWRPHPTSKKGGEIHASEGALKSLNTKELKFNGTANSLLSAISRIQKFAKRGWSISPSSLMEIAMRIQATNFQDPEVLRSEMAGFYGIQFANVEDVIRESTNDQGVVNLEEFSSRLSEFA